MPDTFDNMQKKLDPIITADDVANQATDGGSDDHLLGELFNEINHTTPSFNEPNKPNKPDMTVASDNLDMDNLQPNMQDNHKSPFLSAAIIIAVLVAGVGYWLTSSDHQQTNPIEQTAQTKQEILTEPDVFKPVPIPSPMTREKTPKAVSSEPEAAAKPKKTTTTKPFSATATPAIVHQKIIPQKTVPQEIVPDHRKTSTHRVETNSMAWAVNLMALSTRASALNEVNRLTSKKFHAESVMVKKGRLTLYRIRIPNFTSRRAAEKTRALLKTMPRYRHAWINHYKK